jgi:hypothetical protein
MTMPLTSSEIEHIAAESARKAVRELLVAMGVDANDPKALLEMQRDFALIRDWRLSIGVIKVRALMVAVGIIVSGLIGAVWMIMSGKVH